MLFQLICAFSLVHKFFLIHIGKILKKITIKSYIGTSVVVVVAVGDMTSPKKKMFFFLFFQILTHLLKSGRKCKVALSKNLGIVS